MAEHKTSRLEVKLPTRIVPVQEAEIKTRRTDAKRNAEIAEMAARVIASSSCRYIVFFHDGTKHHNIAQLPPPATPFKFTDLDRAYIYEGVSIAIERIDVKGKDTFVAFDIHADQFVQIYGENGAVKVNGIEFNTIDDRYIKTATIKFDDIVHSLKQTYKDFDLCTQTASIAKE